MTSLLTPAYDLTLGSQSWTRQATRLTLTLALAPRVNILTVSFPAEAPLSAGIGDDAILTLSGGEREEPVFAGTIDSVRRGFDEIRVACLDAGGLLSRFRPAVTYQQVNASTVIRKLAGEMEISIGDLEDGPTLPFYVADPSSTAWEHISRVSAWGGAVASISAENRLNSVVIDASQAEIA